MFASSDIFEGSASGGPESPALVRVMLGEEASSPRVGSASPAVRRQRMQELKEQELAKRRAKAMQPGMVQRADSKASVMSPPRESSSSSGLALTPRRGSRDVTSGVAFASPSAASSVLPPNSRTVSRAEDAAVQPLGVQELMAEREKERESKKVSALEQQMLAAGIAPVFDPVKRVEGSRVKLDLSDMRTFLTSPLPRGALLQCYINRNKKGILNKMYPTYELRMEEDDRFLLASTKRSKNKSSNYILSMDPKNLTKDSASYLGKLRSNFVGTEFVIYDKGLNPKSVDEESASISLLTVRQELGLVHYESNILGSKGPRKMTVAVPAVRKDGTRAVFRPASAEAKDGISAKYKAGDLQDLHILVNKPPKWNEHVGAYVLNFAGRVTMASVKNFQLILPAEDEENVVLQFGRVAKDVFTMDVQHPLSPLQAFAICLSSFDYKLACE